MYIREEADDEELPESTITDMQAAAEHFFGSRDTLKYPIHLSDNPKLTVHPVEQKGLLGIGKPNGLWYGLGNSWAEWAYYNMPDMIKPYVYRLELKPRRLLVIDSLEAFDAFEKTYKVNGISPRFAEIDWKRVASKYCGIQIAPYFWQRRMNSFWYYGWDCASGCVWSPVSLKSVKLYAYYDSDRKEYIQVKATNAHR
jgi:hypothetical protein